MPARYKLLDGSLIDLSKMSRAEQLYVAWLAERLRTGAQYYELLIAVAHPGAYPLGGKPLADVEVRKTTLFRVANDILARAAETAGVTAAELAAVQPAVYYSVTEAGKRLGISRAAIAQAIHEERLPAYKLGCGWIVPAAALPTYQVQDRKVEAGRLRGIKGKRSA